MATSNMKVFSDNILKDAALECERAFLLMNIACDANQSVKDKLVADWITELQERIIELEVSNQNLHKIISTSSFNQTQA